MFSFGKSPSKNNPQIKFKKPIFAKDMNFEDPAGRLCQIGLQPHCSRVVNMKSAAAWEAVHGKRFYFGSKSGKLNLNSITLRIRFP
jgi:hypothetical protein